MENIREFAPAFQRCYALHRGQFPIKEFGTEKRKVTCVAPLFCTPSVALYEEVPLNYCRHALFLDSNVFSYADHEEIHLPVASMFSWAHETKMPINTMLAVMEQYQQPISHEESRKYILNKATRLNDRYDARINLLWLDDILSRVPSVISQNQEYVRMLAEFIVISRYFYNLNSTFEKKCKLLAQLMCGQLPHSVTAYYIACLYFYVRSKPHLFQDGIRKCEIDMAHHQDAKIGWETASNFAFDISMVTCSSWPLQDDRGQFIIPYIATGDRGLAFLLQELCFSSIEYEQYRSFPTVSYRPGSRAFNLVKPIADQYLKLYSPREIKPSAERRRALSEIANDVLTRTFKVN